MHKKIKLEDICTLLDYNDIRIYDPYVALWVYITTSLGKGMNPIILPPTMGK